MGAAPAWKGVRHLPDDHPVVNDLATTIQEEGSKPPETSPAKDDSPPPRAKYASIFPGPTSPLSKSLSHALEGLEDAFGRPIWLLIQQIHGPGTHAPFAHLDQAVSDDFMKNRRHLHGCDEVVLVIDSPGGYAESAYQLARCFKRHCGGFVAVVPRRAMSAATLLTLGASQLFMGQDAQLGPLDAQMFDYERESPGSALDEVQALERLHSTALEEIDRSMTLLLGRTGKKIETLLPMAMKFEAEMMRPLLEKIDTVHYTQQSRILKVAEDYAIRLLEPNYGLDRAEMISRHLVNAYPEHGFVIDREEASTFLKVEDATEEQDRAIEDLADVLREGNLTAMGRVEGGESNGQDE